MWSNLLPHSHSCLNLMMKISLKNLKFTIILKSLTLQLKKNCWHLTAPVHFLNWWPLTASAPVKSILPTCIRWCMRYYTPQITLKCNMWSKLWSNSYDLWFNLYNLWLYKYKFSKQFWSEQCACAFLRRSIVAEEGSTLFAKLSPCPNLAREAELALFIQPPPVPPVQV